QHTFLLPDPLSIAINKCLCLFSRLNGKLISVNVAAIHYPSRVVPTDRLKPFSVCLSLSLSVWLSRIWQSLWRIYQYRKRQPYRRCFLPPASKYYMGGKTHIFAPSRFSRRMKAKGKAQVCFPNR